MGSIEAIDMGAIFGILKLERLFVVALGFAVLVALAKGIHRISQRLQQAYPSRRVLFLQVATMVNFGLYIGGGTLLIYVVLAPPKEILLAIAGSAAVAIGISLKDIVASVVAGIVLLFDRPFQVGDRVSFSGTYGEIVGIGLRTVKLVTLDDSLVTIPNARFLTDVVSSGNAGALDMMIELNFHVAFDADLELAKSLVREVIATSRFTFRKKQISVNMSEVVLADRLAVKLCAKAYVLDCRFEKAFESDVVERVLNLFNEKEIRRPPRA